MRRRPSLRAALHARPDERTCRVLWQASGLLLAYPDERLLADLPLVRAALAGVPDRWSGGLLALAEELSATDTASRLQQQARYVETFDQRRRRTLLLTYYTAGDTRNRGQAMLRFSQTYRDCGASPPPDELPDHLPVVLEFAAAVDPVTGRALLEAHTTPLVMLRDALAEHASPYRAALDAVLVTLPPPGPDGLAEARRLAMAGPPAELVGAHPDLLPYPTVRPSAGAPA